MPKKTRKEKEAIVDDLKEKISRQTASFVTRMGGLNVSEITELRRRIREAEGEFKVTKISLLKFASEGSGLEPIVENLTGPSAVVFAYDDPVSVAKAIKGFSDRVPKIDPVSGMLGERVISREDVITLATLSSRDELMAKLVGTLAAPLTGFAGIMAAIPRQLLYALCGIAEQKEQENIDNNS